jgi:selenocysteine-specific elongation factor
MGRGALTHAQANAVFQNWAAVRVEGDSIALATHRASLSPRDATALAAIEQAFRAGGYAPPPADEVLRTATSDAKIARAMLEALIKNKRLIRISGDLIFHSDVIGHIRLSLSKQKGRRFSVPEFKQWTNISRKFAIPLLEYLDNQHVTRREGDTRIVL